MEQHYDNSGDCPSMAALSPSSATAVVANENTSPADAIADAAALPLADNKLKTQQLQPQQQHHQFRAPQQFVKHKKATACSAAALTVNSGGGGGSSSHNTSNNGSKRGKCWNKRQNRTAKQHPGSGNATSNAAGHEGGSLAVAPVLQHCASMEDTTPQPQVASKADVENIQNIKNQVGSGGGYYPPHYAQQPHHYHGNSALAEGRLNLTASSDKLGYAHGHGHGHLKPQQQQLHKKPLPLHRGGSGVGGGGGGGGAGHHHHHVLCAGSAHNTMGGAAGANSNSSVAGNPSIPCCHINGCGSHMSKDGQSSLGGSSVNGGNSAGNLHFCCLRSKFFLPDKRPRKGNFIPPTKFLLGGNISDPLNLSSLQNEVSSSVPSNTTPATTPRQSPITTPPKVEVIIPPNIHDPLHLLDPVDSMEYEKQLTSPMKRSIIGLPSASVAGGGLILGIRGGLNKAHKHRHRKNRKPKRKRFDSFNSTASSTMGDIADEMPAGLMNSSTSMEKNATQNAKESIADEELHSTAEGEGASRKVGTSPPPTQLHSTAVKPDVPKDSIPAADSSSIASSVGGTVPGEARERASRDLKLDLLTTTASSMSGGSSVVSSTVGGTTGRRKRKISESTNSQSKAKKYFRNDSMDKIVSPVVPQPGTWKRPPRTTASGSRKPSRRSTSVSESTANDLSPLEEQNKVLVEEIPRDDTPEILKADSTSDIGLLGSPLSNISGATSINAGENETSGDLPAESSANLPNNVIKTIALGPPLAVGKPKFPLDGHKFRYGNYDRYAGLRHLNEFMDIRLQVFQQYPELFKDKDILDIGCNVGHMTISVARKLAPKSILGIDIDKELIARARRNLAMYVRIPPVITKKESSAGEAGIKLEDKEGSKTGTCRRRRKKKRQTLEGQHAGTIGNWLQFQNHHHHHHTHPHHHHHHHQLQHSQHNGAHHHAHPHHAHHHHNRPHHAHAHPHSKQRQANEAPSANATEFFPISFPLTYGGIHVTPSKATSPQNVESQSPASSTTTTKSTPGHPASKPNPASANVRQTQKIKAEFPQTVFFRQTNYVLKDESMLANDAQQYDLILCLSVTKWIHLNFGDAGLKLAFKRMFNQLRPGGKLILEAQNWASYKKKKNLTEVIYHNYNNIELFPNKFHEYLLSNEVGFSHSYTLGIPKHSSKGFSRPIQLYAKGDYTPNHIRWSDAYYPQTPFVAYRGIYATMPPHSTGMQSSYPVISSSRSQNYDTPHGGGGASGSYSCRQTPMHQPSTSQYYNPLESDSYQPSYDMEYLNHMYVFASPLYQTVWSPPTSMRKSSSHTPVFGSVRDPESEGEGTSAAGGGSYHRHVYPPNDETSSPNANALNAFNSIRDPDTDDSNQQRPHVYATNCESSSSPHPHNANANEGDVALVENLMLDEESRNNCCDLNEA